MFNNAKTITTLLLLVPTAFVLSGTATAIAETNNQELAEELAVLLRSARKVISDNQKQINRTDIADKGLDPATVVEMTRTNHMKNSTTDIASLDASTRKGALMLSLLDAVRNVMDNAQPLINDTEVGFKGFLPAVFAREVASSFNGLQKSQAYIKLTAPKVYVRNRANRPDKWEHNAIENVLKKPGHPHGGSYFETADHKGRPSFRLIVPEYYGESCLNCHGGPKGELDITGGKKEGGKLGELGGAISVVLYETHSSPASH